MLDSETLRKAQTTGTNFIAKQIDQRSTELGEQAQAAGKDLRTISESLRSNQGSEAAAQLADRLAGYVESVATYLQDADSDRLVTDMEAYARRQPWIVATGAVIAGFAASRFIKSTSTRRYQYRSFDAAQY